jgi:hypothetical protein
MRAVGFAIFAGLAAIACAVSPAHAQASAKERVRIRKITFEYAACVVRKHHAQASEAILATANNGTIMGHFSQIIDADCLVDAAGLNVEMRFPNDSYQYALADALVNADFAARGEASFANRLPLAQPAMVTDEKRAELEAKAKAARQRKEVDEEIGKHNALAWILRFGECVVRQDPASARYWLLTPPETSEEESRIKALQPAFGACLDAGTIKLNRAVMRGTVAVNYYRLAMATAIAGAEGNH